MSKAKRLTSFCDPGRLSSRFPTSSVANGDALEGPVAPFVQSLPKFAGWVLSPETFLAMRLPVEASRPMSSRIPQPTPQYEQTVRTLSTSAFAFASASGFVNEASFPSAPPSPRVRRAGCGRGGTLPRPRS
ncbi:hypothetical protein BEH93_17785 [Streptomyces sp. 2R]|nr:hypothetical protein BEH93_17785 [Streptomyces sp. 2R]